MNAISIIGLIFSGVMLVVSVVNFIIVNIRQSRGDMKEQQRELSDLHEGILKANIKLDQVCTTTSETRTDMKVLHSGLTEMDKRVSVMEHALSDVIGRVSVLEQKADKED